jgi:ferredoxin
MIREIRARVSEKLQELDGVIGLRKTVGGSGSPQGTAPYLYRQGDDLNQLVLTPRYPLALIISSLQKQRPQARIGVVARGCDIRALVEMAKRQQVDPDRLTILGVTCTTQQAQECHCADPIPHVDGWPDAETIAPPEGLLSTEGIVPNPMVAEYESMSLAERQTFWQQQFLKCIKCYGCRNICPECFCVSCALEDPLWVERGVLAPPFPMYHLIKAMHMSARCVACRQCELACPAHIPLTVLYDLLRRDVGNMLGYVPGAELDLPPPLSLALQHGQLRADLE